MSQKQGTSRLQNKIWVCRKKDKIRQLTGPRDIFMHADKTQKNMFPEKIDFFIKNVQNEVHYKKNPNMYIYI